MLTKLCKPYYAPVEATAALTVDGDDNDDDDDDETEFTSNPR